MFGLFDKEIEYDRKRSELIKELDSPSSKNGKKECSGCTMCCWQRPGTLSKEDVPKIAKHLKITEKELFNKYLAVDEIQLKYCLLPIRENQTHISGKFVPVHETYNIDTPCTFLKEKKCSIHEVKPTACKGLHCWEEPNGSGIVEWTHDELMSLGWDGVE